MTESLHSRISDLSGPGGDDNSGPRKATWVERIFGFEVNTNENARHQQDPDDQLLSIASDIDAGPRFNWRVWAVTSSGFFTDAYNLFASNVILPALAFVYWGQHSTQNAITINILTLAGSACGQIIFGILADKYGRQRLYGIELVIVIFSTIGLAQSSDGFSGLGAGPSMSILGWLLAWRFVMGIGIGAEYPLSACIASEWAPRKSRGLMIAAIFIMQPFGQVIAYALGWGVLVALNRVEPFAQGDENSRRVTIDKYWRIITGVGAFVALVAIVFRFFLPETGRYTYGVKGKVRQAQEDTRQGLREMRDDIDHLRKRLTRRKSRTSHQQVPSQTVTGNRQSLRLNAAHARQQSTGDYTLDDTTRKPSDQFTVGKLYSYFIYEGNWRRLAGASLCWFLLDFAFFGLGFNNPGTLGRLWSNGPRPANGTNVESWLLNSYVSVPDNLICNPRNSQQSQAQPLPGGVDCSIYIYDVLTSNCWQNLVTTCIGSVLGSVLMLFVVDRRDRRQMMILTFVTAAALLLGTGIAFKYLFHQESHAVLILLYAIIQFNFSFGPNTLTFIIPAESFPTEYRCTCHGLSAAAGKLGSVLVQVAYMTWQGKALDDPNSAALGYLMILFAGMCLLGALFAWAWLPQVQEGNPRQGKSLEDMSKGRESLAWHEQVGFVNRTRKAWREWKKIPLDRPIGRETGREAEEMMEAENGHVMMPMTRTAEEQLYAYHMR